ncbi:hypothetical protein DID76_00850 [Candidatus Marinamargulisbacteria bacterium SCGC AG-414-C22]|nr:hypothetical protein DID76_00850 [Candidatus Marinamargulisbacteria bacterium SCGC AG-414-C22]
MEAHLILTLAAIPAIGVVAQWVAVRFHLPSILLLLLSGFMVGPVFGLIDPHHILGEIFHPFVSLSVALILFEGGLTLKLSELTHTGKIVRNLITLGYAITSLGTAVIAYFIFGFNMEICLLLGAILAVSGPTVVMPLLRQIKLKKSLSAILKWEGITIDPIGATLSVMVYRVILSDKASEAVSVVFAVIGLTLLSGLVLGVLGATLIMMLFKKKLVPDYLQESFTFIIVLVAYAIAGLIQPESGLLAVTVLGIILANQKVVVIKHIVTFKENIAVLLLSSLFIILAAKVHLEDLIMVIQPSTLLFIALLIFVIRPLSVFASTFRSHLLFKERLFLACLYPRGIVAAAIASVFSLQLELAGIGNAEKIISITFLTIVITVSFYAILGRPLINLLGLHRIQRGVIIVGAQKWARQFSALLNSMKIETILIDTNLENILAAKQENLRAIHGSILSKKTVEEIEEIGFGTLISLTGSDEANLLATIEYQELLGSQHVYRLSPIDKKKDLFNKSENSLLLAKKGVNFTQLQTMATAGATFKLVQLSESYSYSDFKKEHSRAICFGLINKKNQFKLLFEGHKYKRFEDCQLICFMK